MEDLDPERIVPGGVAQDKHAGIAIGTVDGLAATYVYKQPYGTEEAYFVTGTDDGYIVGGVTYTATGSNPLLIRLDLNGTTMWRTTSLFPQQPFAAFHDGAVLSDGTLLLGGGAGSAEMTSANAPLIVRTDGWGNTTCDASGACFGRPQFDCIDLDWCTYNRCTAETGCTAELHDRIGRSCDYTHSLPGCGDRCRF